MKTKANPFRVEDVVTHACLMASAAGLQNCAYRLQTATEGEQPSRALKMIGLVTKSLENSIIELREIETRLQKSAKAKN